MTGYVVHIASLIVCWCTFSSSVPISSAPKTEFIKPNNGQANLTAKSNVVITCETNPPVVGTPTSVIWEKDSTKIGELKGGMMDFKGRYSRTPSVKVNKSEYDLLITDISPGDEGVYQCQKVGKNGMKFGSTVRLHVPQASRPPKLYQIKSKLRKSVNQTAMILTRIGEKLILRCEANGGHPGASIRWRIRGNFIDPNSEGTFSVNSISGSVRTQQKLVSPNRPPRYRDTHSILTAYLNKSHNNTMVTCYAFNAGTRKQQIMSKIRLVISGANSCSSFNVLAISILALIAYFFNN